MGSLYVCGIDLDVANRMLLVGGLEGADKGRVALFGAPPNAALQPRCGGGVLWWARVGPCCVLLRGRGRGGALGTQHRRRCAPHTTPPAAAAAAAARRPTHHNARGMLGSDAVDMVAAVRALPGSSQFVVGESVLLDALNPDGSERRLEQVALYDVTQLAGGSSGGGISSPQPLKQFRGHTDLITCLAPVAEAGGVFLSGALGCGVRVCVACGGRACACTCLHGRDTHTHTHRRRRRRRARRRLEGPHGACVGRPQPAHGRRRHAGPEPGPDRRHNTQR
jgi:hypothetical protein